MTDKSEKELHKKMYIEFLEIFKQVLDLFEQSKTKKIPTIVQIDIISSMFDTNENSEEAEAQDLGATEGWVKKLDLVERMRVLSGRGKFDPKQEHDLIGLLLGMLNLIIEVARDNEKGVELA